MSSPKYDAIIIGAGFAGIYQLYKLRQLNLNAILLEAGSDVGGTWYWNRYPGASSDVHSHVYRYSWDKELLRTYPWKNWYVTQPEVQGYLSHVVDKYDLRQFIRFGVKLEGAEWDETEKVWRVETVSGVENGLSARYLLTAVGPLTEKNIPQIKNFEAFQGQVYHTAAWPKEGVDLKGKRVGVVGNGSTGSQLLIAAAKDAKQVTSFQRNAQWNVPNGNRPVTEEERKQINDTYDEIWNGVRNSGVAFGFPESTVPTFSVSEEERTKRYQDAWDKGNGFRFMFAVFSDITTDRAANDAATSFIRGKIENIVKDPETRRKLIPKEVYARRPICNDGYYELFNQENVSLVSLKETPFTEFTGKGVKTADGVEHELDVLLFATGFDALTGALEKLNIRGLGGHTLKQHWAELGRPSSYLGFSIPSFPNLFTISGPQHAFTNAPPQIEAQVDFVTELIHRTGTDATIEVTPEGEKEWTDLSEEVVKGTLFHEVGGWAFGENIPGKKHNVLFWFGGLKKYREVMDEATASGYPAYKIAKI
jgi:cation diffusion facilitator CzcD-associated flavoprotein CzcO